jgi:thymidylate kinase
MQKVCCIGTHGSGKTTLCYQQAAYYKTIGKNVKLINETARSCPFALNHQFNAYGAMWIIHMHIVKELEAMSRNADIIICDRSPMDSIMYALATGCTVGQQMKNLYKMSEDWMETYDKIYYVRPDGNDAIPDGIRSTDETFRKKIEDHFDDWMEKCSMGVQNKILIIKSSSVFSERECWIKEKVNQNG